MAVDVGHRRLFVAELGNNSVGIVGLDSKTVINRRNELREPQGIAYYAENDSLYVANGGDGSLRIFRGPGYLSAGRIDLGADADNVRVDGQAKRVLVGYGNGAIAVINPLTNRTEKTLALDAHPGSFQFDIQGRVFVNIPDGRSVVVIDQLAGRVISHWTMPHSGNFAMALDKMTEEMCLWRSEVRRF